MLGFLSNKSATSAQSVSNETQFQKVEKLLYLATVNYEFQTQFLLEC